MRWLGVTLAIVAAFATSLPAQAVSTGFIISPAFQSVNLSASQPSAGYVVQLTNATPADQNFRLSAVDFGSLDETGGVAFTGAPTSESEHRYGLAAWMGLGTNTVFLAAGKSTQVTVTISNRPSLAPGGHYGAILATAVTDTGKPGSDPRVNLQQVLSSLILLTKEGGVDASLKLVSQQPDKTGWRLPSKINHRFQNDGNVHVIPRGVVEVKDPFGRTVSRGALNDGSGTILPESFRRYVTPLTSVAAAWMPGRYTLATTYRYDGTEQTKTASVHFWYVGLIIVWLVAIAALGLTGWLVWLYRRRR